MDRDKFIKSVRMKAASFVLPTAVDLMVDSFSLRRPGLSLTKFLIPHAEHAVAASALGALSDTVPADERRDVLKQWNLRAQSLVAAGSENATPEALKGLSHPVLRTTAVGILIGIAHREASAGKTASANETLLNAGELLMQGLCKGFVTWESLETIGRTFDTINRSAIRESGAPSDTTIQWIERALNPKYGLHPRAEKLAGDVFVILEAQNDRQRAGRLAQTLALNCASFDTGVIWSEIGDGFAYEAPGPATQGARQVVRITPRSPGHQAGEPRADGLAKVIPFQPPRTDSQPGPRT